MQVNKPIIWSTLIIMAIGIAHAWTATPPQGITPVVIGGYVLMLILSIVDMFGGGPAQIASAIAMLALVFAVLYEGVPIFQQITGPNFLNPSANAGPSPNPNPNIALPPGGNIAHA